MTLDLMMTERRLKITSRLMYQGMWVLCVVAALMLLVRRSGAGRIGSLWMFGMALLIFMISFAMRDVMRKIGHRNTENKLVDEVKSYLQNQPAQPVEQPEPVRAVQLEPASQPEEACVPNQAAGFVPLPGSFLSGNSADELAVFDSIPSRDRVTFAAQFHAVLEPVMVS